MSPAIEPNDPSESIRNGNGSLSLTAFAVGGAAALILVGVVAGRKLALQSANQKVAEEESDDAFSEMSPVPDDSADDLAVFGESVDINASARSFNPLDCSGSVTVNSISFV